LALVASARKHYGVGFVSPLVSERTLHTRQKNDRIVTILGNYEDQKKWVTMRYWISVKLPTPPSEI
jgi:hypothetical protein